MGFTGCGTAFCRELDPPTVSAVILAFAFFAEHGSREAGSESKKGAKAPFLINAMLKLLRFFLLAARYACQTGQTQAQQCQRSGLWNLVHRFDIDDHVVVVAVRALG